MSALPRYKPLSPLSLNAHEWQALWNKSARGKAHVSQATQMRRTFYGRVPTTRIITQTDAQPGPSSASMRKTRLVAGTTQDLVALAVRRFYRVHRCLPDVVILNTTRFLSIPPQARDFFPIHCEDIGGYTVMLRAGIGLDADAIECKAHGGRVIEVYYL